MAISNIGFIRWLNLGYVLVQAIGAQTNDEIAKLRTKLHALSAENQESAVDMYLRLTRSETIKIRRKLPLHCARNFVISFLNRRLFLFVLMGKLKAKLTLGLYSSISALRGSRFHFPQGELHRNGLLIGSSSIGIRERL